MVHLDNDILQAPMNPCQSKSETDVRKPNLADDHVRPLMMSKASMHRSWSEGLGHVMRNGYGAGRNRISSRSTLTPRAPWIRTALHTSGPFLPPDITDNLICWERVLVSWSADSRIQRCDCLGPRMPECGTPSHQFRWSVTVRLLAGSSDLSVGFGQWPRGPMFSSTVVTDIRPLVVCVVKASEEVMVFLCKRALTWRRVETVEQGFRPARTRNGTLEKQWSCAVALFRKDDETTGSLRYRSFQIDWVVLGLKPWCGLDMYERRNGRVSDVRAKFPSPLNWCLRCGWQSFLPCVSPKHPGTCHSVVIGSFPWKVPCWGSCQRN